MVALTTAQIDQILQAFMEAGFSPPANLKGDIRDAFVDIDDYLETNATAINNALSVNFRTEATAAQKALVLALVAMRRAIRDGIPASVLRKIL